MKLFLCLLVVCWTVDLVWGESCTVASDCVATTCTTGNQTCDHSKDSEGIQQCNGLCSCSAHTGCIHDYECGSDSVTCKPNEHRECVSSHCQCVKNHHGNHHHVNKRSALMPLAPALIGRRRRQATNPCTST